MKDDGDAKERGVDTKAAVERERTWLKHIKIALSNCFTSQSNGSHGNSVHANAVGLIWWFYLHVCGGLWLTETTPAL